MSAILELREAGFALPARRRTPRSTTCRSPSSRAERRPGRRVRRGQDHVLWLLLGLARPTSGEVLFDGEPLDLRDRAQMRAFRRSVQTVFQDPYSSLDPRQSVGRIVGEPLRSLRHRARRGRRRPRVAEALEAVGLPADAARRYPHEFSGGQRQRIAIARAIVCDRGCCWPTSRSARST